MVWTPEFFFVALSLSAATTVQAGQVLVIDDFTDPAAIELPLSPGSPTQIVTPGVGGPGAQRTFSIGGVGAANVLADIDTTLPGQYFVDKDNSEGQIGVQLAYDFPITDFTPYEAIILDITAWPDPPTDPAIIHIPGLTVFAQEAAPPRSI